jgi:hypothetical protein
MFKGNIFFSFLVWHGFSERKTYLYSVSFIQMGSAVFMVSIKHVLA